MRPQRELSTSRNEIDRLLHATGGGKSSLDHAEWGVEVQVLRDLEWFYGHRCDSGQLAVAEADERKAR